MNGYADHDDVVSLIDTINEATDRIVVELRAVLAAVDGLKEMLAPPASPSHIPANVDDTAAYRDEDAGGWPGS